MRRLVVVVALAAVSVLVGAGASTSPGAGVTVSQLCTRAASALQQCSPAQNSGNHSLCCNATVVLQDLGCFCMETTQVSSRSAVSPAVWQTLPSCDLAEPVDFSTCNSSSGASTLPSVPGVIRVPGKGLVQASALLERLGSTGSQAQPLTQATRELTSEQPERFGDTRPVMDLGTVPDDVSIIFSSDDQADMTVTVTEAAEDPRDVSLSVDLDMPSKLPGTGFEFDLELIDPDLVNSWDGLSFTMDVDFPASDEPDITVEINSNLPDSLAVTYSREESVKTLQASEQSKEVRKEDRVDLDDFDFGMVISDDELIRQLTNLDTLERDYTVELDIAVPNGAGDSFGASDVTVEMDVDFGNGGIVGETAITIERSSLSFPLSGQGLGNLMVEAAEWLSAYVPIPLTDEFASSEAQEMSGALGEALQLMSDVGEEIGEQIPEQQLQAGDTIEVHMNGNSEGIVQWSDDIEWSQVMDVTPSDGAAKLFSRRALDSLTEAVRSALYSKQAEQEGRRHVACSVCKFVNRHLQLLWGLFYLNLSLLALCCSLAVIQRLRNPSPTPPTVPESDLEQPLILHASDFAEPPLVLEKSDLLAPVWAPPNKLQQ